MMSYTQNNIKVIQDNVYLVTVVCHCFVRSPVVGTIETVLSMCGIYFIVSRYCCTSSLFVIDSIQADPKWSGPSNSLHSKRT